MKKLEIAVIAIVMVVVVFGLKSFAQQAPQGISVPMTQQGLQDAYDVIKASKILADARCVQADHTLEGQENKIINAAITSNITINAQ